jgi:hypothetical protein
VSATVKPPGPSRRRVRSPTWLAWGPSLSVVAVLLVNLVLFELPDQIRSPATKLSDVVLGFLPILVFAAVGALILSHRLHRSRFSWTPGRQG